MSADSGCCGNLYPDAPYGFAGIQDSGWERQRAQGYAYTTGVAPAYTKPLDVPGDAYTALNHEATYAVAV
eukprot:1685514-Amphidinium_carterae.1